MSSGVWFVWVFGLFSSRESNININKAPNFDNPSGFVGLKALGITPYCPEGNHKRDVEGFINKKGCLNETAFLQVVEQILLLKDQLFGDHLIIIQYKPDDVCSAVQILIRVELKAVIHILFNPAIVQIVA